MVFMVGFWEGNCEERNESEDKKGRIGRYMRRSMKHPKEDA